MAWAQWGTFALAVLGAGLGVFNTVVAYRRGAPRLSIVEDYRPLGKSLISPPRYEVRIENRGNVAIALQRIELVLQAKTRKEALTLYEGKPGQGFVVEPYRGGTFELPADTFFSLPSEGKASIEIKTEASGTFRRRAHAFWRFAAEYKAMVSVASAGSKESGSIY